MRETKACIECGETFETSRTGKTVRCMACRRARRERREARVVIAERTTETCFCGKTVVATVTRGVRTTTGWTCPRECETHRHA